MSDTVIINFANTAGWYRDGQERLRESILKHAPHIDFMGYQTEQEIGSPKHAESPYAFKVYAFAETLKKGYKKIIYCDASMYMVASPDPLLKTLSERGYIMEEAGHWLGSWANEESLKYFNLTREDAMKIPMFSAGFLGLNFNKEICREFFARWKNSCEAGIFKGSWKDHRHDMTCATAISNKLQMQYIKGGTYLSYIGSGYGQPGHTSIFHLKPTV